MSPCLAQEKQIGKEISSAEDQQPLTQAEFAVELVRLMELEEFLPKAPLKQDCINLLEEFGITPLQGWKPNQFLKREDYLTLFTKASGKESVVYQRAWQVEQKNIEIINEKWQKAFEENGEWIPLEEFLNNLQYFPRGAPPSPFGRKYRDLNHDHQIDPHFPPVLNFDRLRRVISAN